MNRQKLAQCLASEMRFVSEREAHRLILKLEEIIIQELLADRDVTLSGFGKFSSKTRAGRVGVNPQNPSEKIEIPSVRVAKFKPGFGLKKALHS